MNRKRARERQPKLRGRGVHDGKLALELLDIHPRATEELRDGRRSVSGFEELDDVALDRFAFASTLTFDAHWTPLGVGGFGTKNKTALRVAYLTVSTGRLTISPATARPSHTSELHSQ